ELKIYSIAAISYGLINFYSGKKLQVQMCGEQWSKRLGCARATTYLQQKALEKQKWLRIVRSRANNKHDRNVLIPFLPHEVFEQLKLQNDNRFKADKRELPKGDAYSLAYLATHKLYFTVPIKFL